MSSAWIDLSGEGDGGGGDGGGGVSDSAAHAIDSPWSELPISRVGRTERRSEASSAEVADNLRRLRESAARGAALAGSPSLPEALSDGAQTLPELLPSPAGTVLAASRAGAFVTRLQTAARLFSSSSLRGSPAAATGRIAAALEEANAAARNVESRYPGSVRAASGRTLNELRQLLESGLAEVTRAASEVERAVGSFEAQHASRGDGARREAERTLFALRDRVVRSEVVTQLRLDVAEATRLAGGGGERGSRGEDASFSSSSSFEVLPAHLTALQRAPDAETIEREAECVLVAFRNFCAHTGSSDSAPGASLSPPPARPDPRAVPRELLDKISSAERRRELASIPRERAAILLEHSRRAIGRAESEADARRLRVVASILEIRAREEGSDQPSSSGSSSPPPSAAALRHLHRRWELRSAELRRGFERVVESARLAMSIATASTATRRQTTARMRQALARSVADAARRVESGCETKGQRWREEVGAAYRSGEVALLDAGRRLSEVLLSGLELYVGTGLLIGGESGGGGGEDDDEDHEEEEDEDQEQVIPLSVWRRERELASDRFVGNGHSGASDPAAAPSPVPSAPRQLLRKTHALALAGFVAWVEYAESVLVANANGTVRAAGAIQRSLGPLRRRFEEMVAAQVQRARGERG